MFSAHFLRPKSSFTWIFGIRVKSANDVVDSKFKRLQIYLLKEYTFELSFRSSCFLRLNYRCVYFWWYISWNLLRITYVISRNFARISVCFFSFFSRYKHNNVVPMTCIRQRCCQVFITFKISINIDHPLKLLPLSFRCVAKTKLRKCSAECDFCLTNKF